MSASGTYEEILPCGGKMQVSKTSWQIEYYFPGPDMRYNGEFLSISSTEVEKYIQALTDNWNEYQALKAVVPEGGEFNKPGKMGMTIRIGSFCDGVCLRSYHMPINKKAKLDAVVQSYRYALQRAPQIKDFLTKL